VNWDAINKSILVKKKQLTFHWYSKIANNMKQTNISNVTLKIIHKSKLLRSQSIPSVDWGRARTCHDIYKKEREKYEKMRRRNSMLEHENELN
jgi:hypothetical protein